MPCYFPVLRVFYRDHLTGSLYSIAMDYHGEPLDDLRHDFEGTFRQGDYGNDMYEKLVLVPCGHCIGCKQAKRKEWTSRMILEDKDERKKGYQGFFITLTYDDDHKPADGNLDKKAFQDFMKRYRMHLCRKLKIKDVRFFACGEYGHLYQRPHYHAIVWLPLDDLKVVQKATESCWSFGFVEVDYANHDRMAYVAGYVSKKLVDSSTIDAVDVNTGEVSDLVPEFILMSRRPGIGSGYSLEKIKETGKLYLDDGEHALVPRYYKDKLTPQEKEDLRIRGSPVDSRYQDFLKSGKTWSDFLADQFQSAVRRLQQTRYNNRKGKREI